jgi:secreted PhoX family phosphatase
MLRHAKRAKTPMQRPFNDEGVHSNPVVERRATFQEIVETRVSRRGFLKSASALAMGAAAAHLSGRASLANDSTLTFKELAHGNDAQFHVAEGYDQTVLIRWGDPVVGGAPPFDPMRQTVSGQLTQFGYNNDFIGYFPLPAGSQNSDHGLLVINHEYTNTDLMFPGLPEKDHNAALTREQVDVEMAAHGLSVIEVKKMGGKWTVVPNSRYARRISASTTEMRVAGPAAGHDRLKTSVDSTGMRVIGTLNNCAGGVTQWGTVLTAEENFNGYFSGDGAGTKEAVNHKRYGLPKDSWYGWHRFHDRFVVAKEPNEANRYGWMVEFDPYDPLSIPVKRTAMGRFKHEGANTIINNDGRVVAYSGDDERFDYLYKFISDRRYDPDNRAASRDILDSGTLFGAKFFADGTLAWLPLVWGAGPLTPENGFNSQADVLIEARRAADLLGATPMDRPEDVEPNPVTGTVYLILTNNTNRTPDKVDGPNPRPWNKHGHVIELVPPGSGAAVDHAALKFRWNILLLAGNPRKPGDGAKYHASVSEYGWLSCPDNCAVDSRGRLWIATDGAPSAAGIADGVWGTDTVGGGRALTRHFLRTPRGAELCGPFFTPDDRTLFVAVQHPGDEKGSTFEKPATRWPDFSPSMPPRPAVVAITKADGGVIGS